MYWITFGNRYLAVTNKRSDPISKAGRKKKEIADITEQKTSPANIVFLYKNNRRGSQTMGMTILSQLAKKRKNSLLSQKNQ